MNDPPAGTEDGLRRSIYQEKMRRTVKASALRERIPVPQRLAGAALREAPNIAQRMHAIRKHRYKDVMNARVMRARVEIF